jgi:hypothetical protein
LETTVLRGLGSLEKAQAFCYERFSFNAVGVVRLSSSLSLEHLSITLGIVQKRHPLLTSRISKNGSKYWFEQGPCDPIPLQLIHGHVPDAWVEAAEAGLSRRFDNSPLLHCAVIRNKGAGDDLLLCAHHAIIDFASGTRLLNELLDTYEKVVSGDCPTTAGTNPFPLPAEHYFPDDYTGLRRLPRLGLFLVRQLAEEILFRVRSKGKFDMEARPAATCRLFPLQLPESITAAILRQARKSKLTLNSLLMAALLLVVNRELFQGDPRYMRYIAVTDLRPKLGLKTEDLTLSSCFAMLRLAVWVSSGSDLGTVAAAVNAQIYQAVRRGDRFCALLLCPMMMRMALSRPAGRMAMAALSCADYAELVRNRESIQVIDFHSCVSNFPMGPPCTAQARVFDGRLTLDFVFLEPELDRAAAARILSGFRQILTEWTCNPNEADPVKADLLRTGSKPI